MNKNYAALIDFLIVNFPKNVKNKTFNFAATSHLFHSLYAYVPSVSALVRERKQIRLQIECLSKLFTNTINDFKLYADLYEFIEHERKNGNLMDVCCPCELLQKSLLNTKRYVDNLNSKQFDIKPPKFKKENFDNILYKYSLNYKNLLMKKKEKHNINSLKRKKKIKQRQILNNNIIYLQNYKHDDDDDDDKGKPSLLLHDISGYTLQMCKHEFVTVESQTRAGDEIVSFISLCKHCQLQGEVKNDEGGGGGGGGGDNIINVDR